MSSAELQAAMPSSDSQREVLDLVVLDVLLSPDKLGETGLLIFLVRPTLCTGEFGPDRTTSRLAPFDGR